MNKIKVEIFGKKEKKIIENPVVVFLVCEHIAKEICDKLDGLCKDS